MPALEVFDTVVLKTNRQLVGIVDRTHSENNDPLEDILIIAHVEVDQAVLTEFVTTGSPPKNYVFVRFSNEAQGSSLVHEDDVVLIDRSFGLGDVVKKQQGHMLGTVTNVKETYVLQPVWLSIKHPIHGTAMAIPIDLLSHASPHQCSSECPFGLLPEIEHPLQLSLLQNVPGEELKKAEDVLEADLILQNDWLGVAEELELMVIVLLDDESIVVVKEPDELYIPVADSGKPLVSLPEFDNLARPDPLVALQGWSATIPPHDFQCGQLVVTNHRNLRLGRWLRGQHNPNSQPCGRILDVRTKSMDVRWLTCNAFIPEQHLTIDRPQIRVSLYDNINTFPNRSELRSNKQVAIYDNSRLPRTTEDRTRHLAKQDLTPPSVRCATNYRVGDHVKFRDQAGAALKYQGVPSSTNILHGVFERIASATTFGFDVNELKIISSRQETSVLWHDGTSSTHLSKELARFTLFEPELAPADLVVAREGLKQVPRTYNGQTAPSDSPEDFNEMKFFEKPLDLIPQRVGIVQNVNQIERVAQVRWFAAPRTRLTTYGHILTADSRFGSLSEVVEDVSLYEIMTFPALVRHLKDLVTIPPATFSATTIEMVKRFQTRSPHPFGQCSLSQINPYAATDLLYWLQHAAYPIVQDAATPAVLDATSYKLHPATDWVGEVVELGLDGTITVRLNARPTCCDVRLEHDQVICLIDDAAMGGAADLFHDLDHEGSDMDMSLDGSENEDTASTISETVEYEGGERLDNDSGDENWEDADEEEGKGDTMAVDEKSTPALPTDTGTGTATAAAAANMREIQYETKAASGNTIDDFPTENFESSLTSHTADTLSKLKPNLPASEPPSFAVLERDVPADQYQGPDQGSRSGPTFLKRVAKEHRILASSLPHGEIFVRTYETRLDLLRCLILGPADTPYEHAPFLIDIQLGKNFPREPPVAHFHSWTSGLGRINPNLYEEGKICLSLLGTWPGKAENEGWSEKATILQLLVSLQGLVFVRQPFYNEAGFEGYAEGNAYNLEAQRYNEKAYVMARRFVKHAVASPVQGVEDVLAWIYLPRSGSSGLLPTVIARSYSLIESSERKSSDEQDLVDGRGSSDDKARGFLSPLSRGAIVMLRKTIRSLEESLLTISDDTQMADADTDAA